MKNTTFVTYTVAKERVSSLKNRRPALAMTLTAICLAVTVSADTIGMQKALVFLKVNAVSILFFILLLDGPALNLDHAWWKTMFEVYGGNGPRR